MKLSLTFLSLLALAASLPVPEIHTVYTIAYTTVFHTVVAGQSPANTQAQVTTVGLETTPATQAAQTQAAQTQAAQDTQNNTPSAQATTAPATAATPATPAASTSTAATSQASGSAPSSGTHSGQGTYYSTGLGSCGITSVDTDYIVAISHELYDENAKDANPNHNPLCGKKITAFYEGNHVEVTVVDRCEGCKYNDLDFSPSAFSQLANQDLGRIDITWNWS